MSRRRLSPADRDIRIRTDGVYIHFNDGSVGVFDIEDYELIFPFAWFISRGYAIALIKCAGGRKSVSMHRYIMNPRPDKEVDHINGNRLDNRRANLRICTLQQNRGATRHQAGISGYRGVSPSNGRYAAKIQHKGVKIHIGTYDTAKDAALAFDKKARELRGEFAITNF